MTGILKQAICDALAAFVRQRPGFDYANYGDATSYRSDSRRASLHKRDAETMLAAVRSRDSISGADILEAARGGRLNIAISETRDGMPHAEIDYTAGQYWCTEYRAGVCRVLASALWNWKRDHAMPAPVAHKVEREDGSHAIVGLHEASAIRAACTPGTYVQDLYREAGSDRYVSAGDYLRRYFRREFGSSLARRWFN